MDVSSEDEELRKFKEEEEEDLELMEEVLKSIKIQSLVDVKPVDRKLPATPGPSRSDADKESCNKRAVSLDNLSLIELQVMLDQVNQARDLNHHLQGKLLKQEVKLMSIKKQVVAAKKNKPKYEKDDLKFTDVGRYYVQFKAPYFKNADDYAGYVVVPERLLPFSAQKFEQQAVQWTKLDLKDLESQIRQFLAQKNLSVMMKEKPIKTAKAKQKIINRFNFLRKGASMSLLLKNGYAIDWYRVSSRMKKPHTPNECEKAWNIFLKPEINKKKWSETEREKLKKIILKHNYEDWDAISQELGTSRNAYQCFHHYVETIMKISEGDWTDAEETFLIHLVKQCTYGNRVLWHKVAYFFETRTITQIYRKWNLSCVGKDVTAGTFTEEDDKMILDSLVFKKGNINQVAKKMNRISSQVRSRLAQLKSCMTHRYGEWTLEEDKLLMELVDKYGKKSWSTIAQHIPTRGRVQIRHRYNNILKSMAKTPNLTLETMNRPKRTVHKDRKRTNLKYALKMAGVNKTKERVDFDTSLGRLVLHRGEFSEDEKPKCRKTRTRDKRSQKIDYEDEDVDDDLEELSDADADLVSAAAKSAKFAKPEEPLCSAITDYYLFSAQYSGVPRRSYATRSTHDLDTVNALLNFTPYRHFDINNAEWAHTADKTDPHYKELFGLIENKMIKDNSNKGFETQLPPCLSTFEGFYDLLKDFGYQDDHQDMTDEALDEEFKRLYCSDDDETVAAVNKWNERMKVLFSWPAALSEIVLENLETQEPRVEGKKEQRKRSDRSGQEQPDEGSQEQTGERSQEHPDEGSQKQPGADIQKQPHGGSIEVIYLEPEPAEDELLSLGHARDPLEIGPANKL